MCVSPITINVKSATLHGTRLAHVPCGKCSECRQQYKNDWAFRLSVELESLKNQGWLIGFGTLTYKNSRLPYIPKEAFEKGVTYRKIQCFRRSDARTFIDSLRKELHLHYKLKGLRYFVASEFGEHTRRSHIHFLVCWQPLQRTHKYALNDILDAETMHRYICRLWRKGFVFPWTAQGGYDKHGYYHKPFEVTAPAFDAAHYASKYACKDLAYKDINLKGVCKKSSAYQDCKQYHIQSKSLGLSLLDNKSNDDKFNLYVNGHSFISKDVRQSLPRYLKNKLLYRTKYLFINYRYKELVRVPNDEKKNRYLYIDTESGECWEKLPPSFKRIVRREPSLFAGINKKILYHKKVDSLLERLTDFCYNSAFAENYEIPKSVSKEIPYVKRCIEDYERRYCRGVETFADHITLYYGYPRNFCFASKPKLNYFVFFNRFLPNPQFVLNKIISEAQYVELHTIYNRYARILSFRRDYYQLEDKERFLNKVSDFYRG